MQNRKRDTDVQNRLLDSVGEGEGGMFRENSIETSILSRVKEITSLGWMHETSAQGWCTGKTQRDGWGGRWEGGSGWGTHVNPWLIHVNVWQNPLQYCQVISLQLIKINRKKESAVQHRGWGFDPWSGSWDPTGHRATKLLHHNYWACTLWNPHATVKTQRSQISRLKKSQKETDEINGR